MCTSDQVAKRVVVQYIKDQGIPERVFDVGMGRGEYGKQLKGIKPDVYMTGLEIFEGYVVDDWGFSNLYDKVHIADMRDFDYAQVKAELVIAGDVIEHVIKEEGIKVIEKLKAYFNWVLIVVPIVDFPQGPENKYGNVHEEHKHQWKPDEMVEATGLKYIGPVGVCGLFEMRSKESLNG